MILGIDEVGRGAWAGPLVVGACVLNGAQIEGLTDSKKLSKKRREELSAEILKSPAIIGLGWVSAEEIDEIGLSKSLVLATKRAVLEVQNECKNNKVSFDEIIIDGTVNFLKGTKLEKYVSVLKKADLLIPSVSAAAICAKVARDSYMEKIGENEQMREYKFAKNVGYGTKSHQLGLAERGISSEHRQSFKPIKTTKEIGDKAEKVVADFLQKENHEIIDRNWRTKFCEIDIISKKENCYYFTEVKYRKNADFGGASSAIGENKIKQMKFAAEYFVSKNSLKDFDLSLAAGLVESEEFGLKDWFEIN